MRLGDRDVGIHHLMRFAKIDQAGARRAEQPQALGDVAGPAPRAALLPQSPVIMSTLRSDTYAKPT